MTDLDNGRVFSFGEWVSMKRDNPELFEQAVQIEQRINEKRQSIGKDRLYLHSKLIPLENIGMQPMLFSDAEMDQCDEGVCFT